MHVQLRRGGLGEARIVIREIRADQEVVSGLDRGDARQAQLLHQPILTRAVVALDPPLRLGRAGRDELDAEPELFLHRFGQGSTSMGPVHLRSGTAGVEASSTRPGLANGLALACRTASCPSRIASALETSRDELKPYAPLTSTRTLNWSSTGIPRLTTAETASQGRAWARPSISATRSAVAPSPRMPKPSP
jgi:hypothetical protein